MNSKSSPSTDESREHGYATIATSPGRGAVGTILAIDGNIEDLVNEFFRPLGKASLNLLTGPRFGRWRFETSDEELVLFSPSENRLEIHCHGGPVPCNLIKSSLESHGYHFLSWEAWEARTGFTPDEVAIGRQLRHCTTLRTAEILHSQLHGTFSKWASEIQQALERREIQSSQEALERKLALESVGSRLVSGWKVVICGPPNVGKSSLLNRLAGYGRVIVYDQPGTTRDLITISSAIDGWPIQLYDTAGLRPTENNIEAAGIAKAIEAIKTADLVIVMVDAQAVLAAEKQSSLGNSVDPTFDDIPLSSNKEMNWEELASWLLDAELTDPEIARRLIETKRFRESNAPRLEATAAQLQLETSTDATVLQPEKKSWLLIANKIDQISADDTKLVDAQVDLAISALESTAIAQLTQLIGAVIVSDPPQPAEAVAVTENQRQQLHALYQLAFNPT